MTIKSPDEDEITPEQSGYIADFFNSMEDALFSNDFTDSEKGYRRYLDLESFLRYFILCELNGNIDSFWSMYMWKDRNDDRFHVGPVWDVDLGFQNYGSPYPVDQLTDFIYTHQHASLANGMRGFVDRIVKNDSGAKETMAYLWSVMREKGNFNYEYFEKRIDAYAEELAESQDLNFKRWPILGRSVQKDQKVFGSYAGEIENMKSYLRARFPKLDALIGRVDLTSIDLPEADATESVELYDLQGRKVDMQAPSPGIYIERRGGKTRKVVIR